MNKFITIIRLVISSMFSLLIVGNISAQSNNIYKPPVDAILENLQVQRFTLRFFRANYGEEETNRILINDFKKWILDEKNIGNDMIAECNRNAQFAYVYSQKETPGSGNHASIKASKAHYSICIERMLIRYLHITHSDKINALHNAYRTQLKDICRNNNLLDKNIPEIFPYAMFTEMLSEPDVHDFTVVQLMAKNVYDTIFYYGSYMHVLGFYDFELINKFLYISAYDNEIKNRLGNLLNNDLDDNANNEDISPCFRAYYNHLIIATLSDMSNNKFHKLAGMLNNHGKQHISDKLIQLLQIYNPKALDDSSNSNTLPSNLFNIGKSLFEVGTILTGGNNSPTPNPLDILSPITNLGNVLGAGSSLLEFGKIFASPTEPVEENLGINTFSNMNLDNMFNIFRSSEFNNDFLLNPENMPPQL